MCLHLVFVPVLREKNREASTWELLTIVNLGAFSVHLCQLFTKAHSTQVSIFLQL